MLARSMRSADGVQSSSGGGIDEKIPDDRARVHAPFAFPPAAPVGNCANAESHRSPRPGTAIGREIVGRGCPDGGTIRDHHDMHELTLTAPFAGTVIALAPDDGEAMPAGTAVVVLEAMKMEHEIVSEATGRVLRFEGEGGEAGDEGQVLAVIKPDGAAEVADAEASEPTELDGGVREDVQSVADRHFLTLDAARPEAVARRRERGRRTARQI